ncbi:MAG: ribosomal protein S18-alanine N-acetyltransferase [Casimicrobium sp.]
MSSLSFSTATVQLLSTPDIEAVVEIERLSNSHPWTERNFHDALASGYLCLIARDQGAVCGFAVSRLLVDEAELLLIAVTPAMRRQGVALLLWIELAERLKASGARTVHLEVRQSNLSAQEFYRTRGFTQSGVRPKYYPNGARDNEREDAVLMQALL